MKKLLASLAASLTALAVVAAAVPAGASAFVGWRVNNVSANDVLNVRAWPSSQSQILVGYPNGTPLSMTGPCTGNVRVDTIQQLPHWQQRQIVRYVWCQVWVDPTGNGNWREGWVYGRYITPM